MHRYYDIPDPADLVMPEGWQYVNTGGNCMCWMLGNQAGLAWYVSDASGHLCASLYNDETGEELDGVDGWATEAEFRRWLEGVTGA